MQPNSDRYIRGLELCFPRMSVQTRSNLLREGSGEYPHRQLSTHVPGPNKRIFINLDQARNLSGVINQLGGTVNINCSTSGGTTSCQFLQDVLKSVFGSSGLQLSGCTFGECVRQNVIDFLVSGGTNSSSSNAKREATHLSEDVIAGLAVVGGLVLGGILLLLWGFITQRRARRDTTAVPKTGGVTVEWKNIDYSIPSSNGTLLGEPKTGDGKVILHNLSGAVRPGEMLAVLGPSGEHSLSFSLVPL